MGISFSRSQESLPPKVVDEIIDYLVKTEFSFDNLKDGVVLEDYIEKLTIVKDYIND